MKRALRWEYGILGASLAGLMTALGVSVWPVRSEPAETAGYRNEAAASPVGEPAATPAEFATDGTLWDSPRAQSRGSEWIFEVFAPPVIFVDPATRRFAAVAREKNRTSGTPETGASGDQPPEFRLRLVGYAGKAGGRMAIFENRASGETLLAREGRRFPELALVIEAVTLQRRDVADPTGACEPVVVARVRDEITGELVVLTTAPHAGAVAENPDSALSDAADISAPPSL